MTTAATLAKQKATVAGFLKFGATQSAQLVDDIQRLLCNINNTSGLFVSMNGLSVTPALLGRVGDAVRAGKIQVVLDASAATGAGTATYMHGENVLYVTFSNFGDLFLRGAIIHEATHAVHDMRCLTNVPTLDNEMLAYTTQAMYYRFQGKHDNSFANNTKLGKALMEAAFSLADFFLPGAGTRLLRDLEERKAAMQKAILAMPEYSGKANEKFTFDGL